MKRPNQRQMRVWHLSGLIFQGIALITLAVAFILFWIFSEKTPFVWNELISNEITTEPHSDLHDKLYRMLPVLFGSILFSVVIAFYLEEWMAETSWKYRIIAQQIAILAGIPSLIYGLLGIYFFVFKTEKGSVFAHAITFALLVVPITVQSTQKAIRDVDISVREAAYALGAKRWRVIVDHVFPDAFPAIVVGICAAISRALAIAALIIVVYIWTRHTLRSGETFNIPSSAIVLLSSALLSSVLASLLKKKQI